MKGYFIFIILLLIGVLLLLNGSTHIGAIYELQLISGIVIIVVVLVFGFVWSLD